MSSEAFLADASQTSRAWIVSASFSGGKLRVALAHAASHQFPIFLRCFLTCA